LKTDVDKLLEKHQQLNQLDAVKVVSHVQRKSDGWILNTVMIDGYDVPFKYRRKTAYRNLQGADGAHSSVIGVLPVIRPSTSMPVAPKTTESSSIDDPRL